jgi:hypothetical protein
MHVQTSQHVYAVLAFELCSQHCRAFANYMKKRVSVLPLSPVSGHDD